MRLGPIFPARARDLVHINQQLIHGDGLEIMIATLARKILYTLDRAGSISGRLNDYLKPPPGLRIIDPPQHQLGASQDSCQCVIEVVSNT